MNETVAIAVTPDVDPGPLIHQPLMMFDPWLEVDISRELGEGYTGLFDDVLRMVCIQFTIQMMIYFSSSSSTSFLSVEFLLMLVYVVLGVALYWLVLKRIVVFK